MPTAFVTGASQGLGFHISRALKDAGYRVLGAGLASSPDNDALDEYLVVDLGRALVDVPFEEESIDVLVNNAAVYVDDPRRGYGDFFNLRLDDLRHTFEVNLFGAVQLIVRHAPRMIARTTGRIVNVSSGMGRLQDADGASFAYRSSKLALNSLTLTVSRHFESSPGDLSAFSYCPGWIRTKMGTERAADDPKTSALGLVELLGISAARTNGRFFRRLDELSWDSPARRDGVEHGRAQAP